MDSEAKKRAIVDNMVDGLITTTEEGRIETFNKACERIFAYGLEEVIGSHVIALIPDWHQDDSSSNWQIDRYNGKIKSTSSSRETDGVRKDGDSFPIELSLSVINVKGRKLYSGIVRDITERKKAEEEITRSNLELERFAYIASHDLQEPLRMVSNFTDLLKEEYGSKFDEDANTYMGFVIDASRRMQELVSDLLEYSRMDSEENGFSEFDSGICISKVLDSLKENIRSTNTRITSGDFPSVYANPVQFSRLIQNLLSNAIKYRSQDKNPEIYVRAEQREGDSLFIIRDNGIGIKEEYAEQIFVIFKRLHNKNEYSGTGIGLAICKKIVENFGGKIWVESEKTKAVLSISLYLILKSEIITSDYGTDKASGNSSCGR